jgi:membrane protease YdiL (CAAX protease family)
MQAHAAWLQSEPMARSSRTHDALAALKVMAGAWSIMVLAPLLCRGLGVGAAPCVTLGVATLWVVAPSARVLTGSWTPARGLGGLLAGGSAGWTQHPSLCAWIGVFGVAMGLEPMAGLPAADSRASTWLATVFLAPVFEETLYRARLLPALRATLGPLPALVISSALFALPHLEPWRILGTFVAGLGLGSAWLTTRNVFFCMGLHAGMNVSGQMWTSVGAA